MKSARAILLRRKMEHMINQIRKFRTIFSLIFGIASPARLRGVAYTIESDFPELALAVLQPYLKTDVLDTMVYDAAQ
jgi:hypothetical protein